MKQPKPTQDNPWNREVVISPEQMAEARRDKDAKDRELTKGKPVLFPADKD